MLHDVLFFIFVQISLLVPGYVVIRRSGLLAKNPGAELCAAYLITVTFYATLAVAQYAFGFSRLIPLVVCWIALLASLYLFYKNNYWKDLAKLRFPLLCLLLMSLFSLAFVGLSFGGKQAFIPDPQHSPDRNYNVANVKVLNIAHTPANDNYVPYRQAQFFINRSNPSTDSFIQEWGVHFFQRTPLMGAVTANYFNLFHDTLPIDYTWSKTSVDPDRTYTKFQIIAQILNSLFIVPAFFLLARLFNRKTAVITSLFLILSPFFLYNSFFSWPKSFVAFFVLTAWLLLLEKRIHYTYLAAAAGGLAYLTHDLAVIYIGATVLYLLYERRLRDAAIFTIAPVACVLAWVTTATLVYHRPSTFIYYPFSTQGIPANGSGIFHTFIHTPITRLIAIRLDSLYYLLIPYDLIHNVGSQELARRAWVTGIFSVPGAVGIGLIIPTLLAFYKKMATKYLLVMVFIPLALCVTIIGWPKGMGALHFAEAVVVLLSGLGVYFLAGLRRKLWLALAFVVQCLQLIFFIVFSFDYKQAVWLHHGSDLLRLGVMALIIIVCGTLLYLTAKNKKSIFLPA